MSHLRGESLSRKPSLMSILRLWRAKKSHKCVLQTSQLLYAFLLQARTAKTSTTSYLCPLKMRRTDYYTERATSVDKEIKIVFERPLTGFREKFAS